MGYFDYFLRYYYHHDFGTTYILTELFCCLAISVFFNVIHLKDYKAWIRLIIDWAITFICYLFIACFFYYIYELAGATNKTGALRFFVWAIVAYIHSVYPKNLGRLSMRLTCSMASSLFVLLAINLSGSLGSAVTDTIGGPSSLWNDITFYLIMILIFGVILLFKAISPFKFKYVKRLPIILINISYGISYALVVLSSFLLDGTNSFMWMLYIGLLVLNVLAYAIFYLNVKNYNDILDFQARALKAESEKKQMEISKAQYEELHRIRHDLKNQMAALESLLNDHKYEEMKSYFSDLYDKVHVTIDFVDSSNPIIDSILNTELSKSKAYGIPLRYKLSIPSELNIRADDLNSLISNLIDNALEYEVSNKLKDQIEFSLIYHGANLLVNCQNALIPNADEKEILKLKSKKIGRSAHGYGTKIIKSICEKYHGVYKFRIENQTMIFEGMLSLEEEKK